MYFKWICQKCKGDTFNIVNAVAEGDTMTRQIFLCAHCGQEFFALGNSHPMKLVRAEDKLPLAPPVPPSPFPPAEMPEVRPESALDKATAVIAEMRGRWF